MPSSIKMFFDTKTINLQRKNNNVKRVLKPPIMRNPQLLPSAELLTAPMIQRVVSGRTGCSACGK